MIHIDSGSEKKWDDLCPKKIKSKESKVKKWLNIDAVGLMTLDLLREQDPQDELLGWFKLIKKKISSFEWGIS